jgi:hypothetical protein
VSPGRRWAGWLAGCLPVRSRREHTFCCAAEAATHTT